MNRNILFTFISQHYAIEPDYPWGTQADYAVLRHTSSRKWFGLVFRINAGKLDLMSDRIVDVINLKVHPEMVGALRQQPDVFPAYHMNKEHWISVPLEGGLCDTEILSLLDESYNLTRPRSRGSKLSRQ